MPRGFIPKKYTNTVFSCYMAAIMALLMSLLLVAVNTGLDSQYPLRVLKAYAITMPTAFICVLSVRSLVSKLTNLTIISDSDQ